ncbi:hypothetical protein EJ03DRAFT_332587 [Teratosphaeria nubilosa]|uniref:Uncharacterized protein n=1 Tax=Teratosphaeria nubilosa TaxID=161662 RepID=A0A6G1KTY3_9PEZI|nr:hypothetical protein EJ03DRAFT_332587 [Teratosphaeria nubilosa]
MSKHLKEFFPNFGTPKLLVAKLRTASPGRRILPVNRRDDEAAQFRIDAGEKVGGKVNLTLQVNSQAKGKA